LFARAKIQEIADFNTTQAVLLHEYFHQDGGVAAQFLGLANASRLFPFVQHGDNTGVLETKYLLANPSFAPGGNLHRTRNCSLCFAEKSVATKSWVLFLYVDVSFPTDNFMSGHLPRGGSQPSLSSLENGYGHVLAAFLSTVAIPRARTPD
jgi:hypothetical protein